MKYKFTNEHKQWVKELITATGSEAIKLWLYGIGDTVYESQLESLEELAPEDRKSEIKKFINSIKK